MSDAETRTEIGLTSPAPLTLPQQAVLLLVGSIGMLIAGVQPVVLGALLSEHRLTASSLGVAATAEFIALAAGAGLAGALLKPDRLRLKGAVAALALAVVDWAATGQAGGGMIADRAAAGLAEGVLIWLPVLMITREARPARWAAIFLVLQGVLQVVFAAALPLTLMKSLGANGCFVALAATAILALACAPLLPSRLAMPGATAVTATRAKLSPIALLSLASVFLIYAFFIGFFAYLGEIAEQAHLSAEQGGYAISLAVGLSIIGSGVAGVIAERLSHLAVTLICLPVFLFVVAAMDTLPAPSPFIWLSSLFGLFWGLSMPYQTPFVIDADPSRRAALIQPGVQGVGAAAGPLLCSLVVREGDARPSLQATGACLVLSAMLAVAVWAWSRRRALAGAPAADILQSPELAP